MKQGKVAKILAIGICCPECGGVCNNLESGSSMIEERHEIVQCEECGLKCAVPAQAFYKKRLSSQKK